MLMPDKQSSYIGIDLGGTKLAAAVVDAATGELSLRRQLPTEAHAGPDAVLRRIAGLVGEICETGGLPHDAIAGLGVGFPGVINPAGGQTIFLPNLPGDWNGKPVAATLRDATSYPVHIINDARAFTLAEATWGAGRSARTTVCLTLGTGIGGGITIDGKLHMGLDGTAGEVGHQTIDPNGPPCGCGNRGCLEAFASGPAIATLGIKAVLQGATTKIGELAGYDLNRITPETIMQAAEAGDLVAREILDRVGSYLGTGIANLITILSPDRVILGGSVARLGEWLLAPVRATVRQRCHATPIERVQITLAALGGDAGIIGAAVWASQQKEPYNG